MSASIYWSVALYFIQDIGSRLAWGVWVEMQKILHNKKRKGSRLAWGVWVEILIITGEGEKITWSRLAWGVWVEISFQRMFLYRVRRSRLAWGVWVEMAVTRPPFRGVRGHASHEACELKCCWQLRQRGKLPSRLAWGVWVEMISDRIIIFIFSGSRLAWGVWVEISKNRAFMVSGRCHASHEACELKFL